MSDLVFVSAQPDIPYFHWQTKVYIHNFIEKGINPADIHVLFSIVDGEEPSERSLKLRFLGVNVYHYIDNREKKFYIPTLRPLILSQWLKENPHLSKCYFYHDSDIIFRELPDFENLINDDICYLSDTVSYIGYDYIKECGERYEKVHSNLFKGELINRMCDVVGISPELIVNNKDKSGGAQYLLKNVDYTFWDKVFIDSERLHMVLFNFNNKNPINNGIQIWTSDMWAVLWNLWLLNNKTEITPKLSFSWATDNITSYYKHSILHMAGITEDLKQNKFYKGEFTTIDPLKLLDEDNNYFDYIDDDSITKKYVEVMKSVIKNDKTDYLY